MAGSMIARKALMAGRTSARLRVFDRACASSRKSFLRRISARGVGRLVYVHGRALRSVCSPRSVCSDLKSALNKWPIVQAKEKAPKFLRGG